MRFKPLRALAAAAQILMGTLLMTTEVSATPNQALRGLDNPLLAFNPSPARDFSPGIQFLDLMKTAREFHGHSPEKWGAMKKEELEAGGYLDENGWPTSIPEGLKSIGTIWSWGKNPDAADHGAGTYILNYKGQGTFKLRGDVEVISSVDGQVTFEAKGGTFSLDIYETDPVGTGNYIRDITILKEEDVPLYELGAVFNPDWVNLIEDARELRFMDWMETNGSHVVSWDQRITPQSSPSDQVALEHMVQLANEVGADPWFNMPHMADEEYIRNFATYVRDNLDPNLKVKVEYSNENWNWAFEQTKWLLKQSQEQWGVDAHVDYHAKKAVETALIWEDVFGDQADARLVNVLGGWTNSTRNTEALLDPKVWKEKEPDTYVDPKTVFEEIAVTTYFGSSVVGNKDYRKELIDAIADPNIDANAYLFSKLMDPNYKSSIPHINLRLQAQAEMAKENGLGLSSYEGGQHVHHSFAVRGLSESDKTALTDFLMAFARSPEMAELYKQSWEGWAAASSGPYMQFGDMLRPNEQRASFGVFESMNASGTTEAGRILTELNEGASPWFDEQYDGGTYRQQGVVDQGTSANDTLSGTIEEDYLLGAGGDDVFFASAGNDGIHGGNGIDRYVLNQATDSYTIKKDGIGYAVQGPDGRDFIVSIEELQLSTGEVKRIADLAEDETGALVLLEPQVPTKEPSEETSTGSPPVDSGLTRIEISDPNNGGMIVQAVNKAAALGRELALTSEDATYIVTEKGATAEINGQTVKANYWVLNENKVSRDGPLISSSAKETVEAFGEIYMQADVIVLGDGNDKFRGRNTESSVFGGDGRDALRGGKSDDYLDGGDGDDWISGGGGSDVLMGGEGGDRFYFRVGDGDDRITDFESSDTLLLDKFFLDGQAQEIKSQSDGLVISNGSDSILLEGLTENDMSWVIQDNLA